MRNAIRYSDRITIGAVPTSEDLDQLRDFAYRTIIDLRSEEEKLGRYVERTAEESGLRHVSIPTTRARLGYEDVARFYEAVFIEEPGPMYAFSRFGKRPLGFLVLFDVVSRGEPTVRLFERGARYGLNLEGDMHLQIFLVKASRDEQFRRIVESIRRRIEEASERAGPQGDL